MKQLLIGALVAALALMVWTLAPAKLQSGGGLLARPAVDAKWAQAMARKASEEARADAREAGRRRAMEACLGPDREALSTKRYEARVKACEARLGGAAAPVKAEPVSAPDVAGAPEAAAGAANTAG